MIETRFAGRESSPLTALTDGANDFIRRQGRIQVHLSHVQRRTVGRSNDEFLAINALDPHLTLNTSLLQQLRQLLLRFGRGKSSHGFISRTGTFAVLAGFHNIPDSRSRHAGPVQGRRSVRGYFFFRRNHPAFRASVGRGAEVVTAGETAATHLSKIRPGAGYA